MSYYMPDVEQIDAEVERAVGRYAASKTRENIIGRATGVEVRTSLNDELLEIAMDDRTLIDLGTKKVGEFIVEAMRDAARQSEIRRDEIAAGITVFDEPVVETVHEMQDDPERSRERLAAPRYW